MNSLKKGSRTCYFNSSNISKAILKAMKTTTEEIEVKKSGLHRLVYEVVEAKVAEFLLEYLEKARNEIKSQIHNLSLNLRKLKVDYNRIICKKDINFYRVLNFLKRILSRAKTTIEAILFIKGVYEIIILVQSYIASKHTSLSLEHS